MDRYNKTIQVKWQTHYHQEQYDIHGRSSGKAKCATAPRGSRARPRREPLRTDWRAHGCAQR